MGRKTPRAKNLEGKESKKYIFVLFLVVGVVVFSIFYSFNVGASFLGIFGSKTIQDVSSGVDCWTMTGNYSGCSANSNCMWSSNNGTIITDPYCAINSTNYNSNSLTMWIGGSSKTYNTLTGGLLTNAGCCIFKPSGGAMLSCNSFNGNKTACSNSSSYGVTGCEWKPNDANQNSWCMVKKIGDWTPSGAVQTMNDVGCCEMQGCWTFSGVQTESNNCTAAFGGGVCKYNSYGSGCPQQDGCCSPKTCSEMTDQAKCERLTQMGNPCVWSGSACQVSGGGGFNMFNTTDSCFTKGGWWNASGSCVMPGTGGGSGGGGFMFAQEARCWFGDQKQSSCLNITGCVYCTDSAAQLTNASSACYNTQSGMCKGHEPLYNNWNGTATVNVTDINQTSMTCENVKTKQICNCGPLPNCVWSNSSAVVGEYCSSGMKSDTDEQACSSTVKFCEDSSAKNNYTLCMQLANDYMMPCKWENSTTPAQNCTFNIMSVFGSSGGGGGGFDYNLIGSESSCIAGGGSWKSEYYVDSDGSFKSDSWCEKGALVSLSTGTAFANKGNCNIDCWACEFQANGTKWANEANASAACAGSAKGICQWRSDENAPNRQGYCDYPKEFILGGVKDCGSDCKACEFVGADSISAQAACSGSSVGCNWINDTNAMNGKGGYCMALSKKSCTSDCFSCYSQTECSNSTYHTAMNCSWDSSYKMCKPFGFTGEVCFNGVDDDNDGKSDCADSDCTYDMFCGGGSIGSGSTATDCKKKITQDTCGATKTSGGRNCTWTTPSWGGQSYCDYPGADCWMFDTNTTACRGERGCIYRNATGGYPDPSTLIDFKSFAGFCEINRTKSDLCYNNATRRSNETACLVGASECYWVNDSYSTNGGRCEFKPFAVCGSSINVSDCSSKSTWCAWKNNSYSTNGGFCEPKCGSLPSDISSCNGFCAPKASICEPEGFGGMEMGGPGAGGVGGGYGCHVNDGNRTGCTAQNMSCSWKTFSLNVSTGVCNPKGEQAMMEGMDMSPPKILGQDTNESGMPPEIDIREFGIKDSDKSLSFGIIMTNITEGAVCRGYYIGGGFGPSAGMPSIGNGTTTTQFYWYLDTNKNVTDGCNATSQTGANLTGFEFMIKYVISLNNLTVNEQKSFMKCTNEAWSMTNVPLTSNRQMMCGMSMPGGMGGAGKVGGVMMMIDKENLESFTSYNKSTPMRVFVSSANGSYSELNPLDSATGVGYYTAGTADFKFIDCGNPSNKNDNKCKQFNTYGFNVFEDCKNGVDDDSDGSADCLDMKCKFAPVCVSGTGAFNFSVDVNDHESPSALFSQIDTISDGAFIKFDSDEPANGTVQFYGNDSGCSTVNATISDIGDPSASYDDYKPFHMVSIEPNTLPGWTNGLQNGTTYYYKTDLCDPSGNCATSACQNFTTKLSVKSFILKMKLPPGFNVSIKGGSNWMYNGNFTTNVGGTQWYDAGVKVNTSISRNMNITFNCGNQSLGFVGVDLSKPKSIDMTGAFICETNSTNNILGMNSSLKSWNQVVSDLGMGGASDYIKLSFPLTYSSSNNISWCNDERTNCTAVSAYANCSSGGTAKTDCRVPTSLGFSAYQVVAPAVESSTPSSSSGGGGGGGGGGTTASKNATNTTTINLGGGTEANTRSSGDNAETQQDIPEEKIFFEKPAVKTAKKIIWIIAIIAVIIIAVGIIIGKPIYDFSILRKSVNLKTSDPKGRI